MSVPNRVERRVTKLSHIASSIAEDAEKTTANRGTAVAELFGTQLSQQLRQRWLIFLRALTVLRRGTSRGAGGRFGVECWQGAQLP